MSERRSGARNLGMRVLAAGWMLAVGGGAGGDSALAAQEPGSRPVRDLTPEEAVRMALDRNVRIEAADADAAAAGAREREVRADLYPSISGQANYLRIGGDIPAADVTLPGLDTTFTILPVERDRYTTELGVEQILFAGGRVQGAARAAARNEEAAERTAEQVRVDVALEVRTAYWTLYTALAKREATEVALTLVEEHLRDVRSRYDEGVVLRSEVLAAETRRSEVALERIEAENAVRVCRLELNRLLGLPAGTEVRPVAEPAFEPLPAEMDGFVQRALANQPRLRSRQAEVEALRAQAAAVRGSRLPEVAATGRYVYARPNPYAFTDQSSFRGTWEAGVALRWPLWEGGAREARVAEARERLRAAEARLEDTRDEAGVAFARSYLEARRAMEAAAVAEQHVEQAAEALRVTRQQFLEGAALSADVLEAERTYREAQAREARAMAERAIAGATIRHALGQAR